MKQTTRGWLFGGLTSTRSAKQRPVRLAIDRLEDRTHASTAYLATDLISDQAGVAPITDPSLVNGWGISLSPTTGGFWVSSNGKGFSEVYMGNVAGSAITQPLQVTIPDGVPTGQVFNNTGSTTDFQVTDGTNTQPATFMFASETGAITGWNMAVDAQGTPPSKTAERAFQATDGAAYTGLALASSGGKNFLYAADFHNGKIDVIDGQFHKVTLGANGFENFKDPNLPAGFAPFNIAAIGGKLYVSYAKQDMAKMDDVPGKGNGFIDVFETNGHFDQRLVSGGSLNSPWGMVQAPANFGDFSSSLLVGNSGDGRIYAYNATTGQKLGTLAESRGHPVAIDGLRGLAFGNGTTAGDANSLYFSAGPAGETHGLFGKITANAAGTNPVSATLTGTDLAITGSPDNDNVHVSLDQTGSHVVVTAGGQQIGTFTTTAVTTIHFNGFAGNDTFIVSQAVKATVIADGGVGSDTLVGGGGNNILIGGRGADTLTGGSANDILVGGSGMDTLFGGGGQDIEISGTTTQTSTALQQILTVWDSNQTYEARVAAIRAGTGGVPKLDATTVADDGVQDNLTGGTGRDWFFRKHPDLVHDRVAKESAN